MLISKSTDFQGMPISAPLPNIIIGKQYRVIGNGNRHGYDIGSIVTVSKLTHKNISHNKSHVKQNEYYTHNNDSRWYVLHEDLEEI